MLYIISVKKKGKIKYIGMYRDKITAERVMLLIEDFAGKGSKPIYEEINFNRY